MPYIAIKSYPRDESVKRALVEKINKDLIEITGCSEHAVTISYEEIEPEKWQETVVKTEIEPKADKMYIVSGEKKY